ncbi:HDIG domain-containing protein [Micromonospora sp. R77]|uniref:HDIG domain-containing metalloprotein n=1 Tax=Micromonospora sp. R77 TaxID=2925836 RepID=UPI001F603D0C|nr:HDIG domain-containing metalloprotein [Micromonospora sp. R77]MCI4065928.1 HDIG domain-containing protein [Micromonospora sp. R77]
MTVDSALVIPTDEQIRALHERFAPTEEAFTLVYTHCLIVCAVAEQLLDRHPPTLDVDLVRAGSLLHDIGVYRLYGAAGKLDQKNYIRHGVLGHALLRDLGLPERVGRFCSHHTGVGLTREDVLRQCLPLPVDDYTADTPEEQLVLYADKFHSKTTPPTFLTTASYAAGVRRFGADKVARFAALVERFGEPDLLPLSRHYRQPLT